MWLTNVGLLFAGNPDIRLLNCSCIVFISWSWMFFAYYEAMLVSYILVMSCFLVDLEVHTEFEGYWFVLCAVWTSPTNLEFSTRSSSRYDIWELELRAGDLQSAFALSLSRLDIRHRIFPQVLTGRYILIYFHLIPRNFVIAFVTPLFFKTSCLFARRARIF